MQIKGSQYKIKGMNKDLSYSAFNPEYSWENKNIRLTARDNNDLLSVTNEKGTLAVNPINNKKIIGIPLGSCVINDNLVLFTHGENENVVESISGLNVNVKSIYNYDNIETTSVETSEAKIINHEYSCPDGYELINNNGSYSCKKTTIDLQSAVANTNIVSHYQHNWYSTNGAAIYKKNGYNVDGSWDILDNTKWPNLYTKRLQSEFNHANVVLYQSGPLIKTSDTSPLSDTENIGRLNHCGIWSAGNQSYIGSLGFEKTIAVSSDKWHYIGVGSDNYGSIEVDGIIKVQQNLSKLNSLDYLNDNNSSQSDTMLFKFWNIYPIFLSAGSHTIRMTSNNLGNVGALGFEIYDATEEQIVACTTASDVTSTDPLDLSTYTIFTTSIRDVPDNTEYDIDFHCSNPLYSLVDVINQDGTHSYSCQKTTIDETVATGEDVYGCSSQDYELVKTGDTYSCQKLIKNTEILFGSILEIYSNIKNQSEDILISFNYINNDNVTISVSDVILKGNNKAVFNIKPKIDNSIYYIFNIKITRSNIDITIPGNLSFSWNKQGYSSWVIPSDTVLYLNNIGTSVDHIYKLNNSTGSSTPTLTELYNGNLNFNLSNKIQTLPFYENESIQKVYWIDGLNQPRVINIESNRTDYTDSSFDFVQNLQLNETSYIEKIHNTGTFKSGVIQYATTYFNKNGSESNLFWISDINYISPDDRAGKPDEIIRNSFNIKISGLEDKYDYVRIYSIFRSSIDSTPEVKSIVDLKIPESGSISYVDNGTIGSIIDSQFLLYVGGEELIPQCMSQKNNTLFFGNIKLPNDNVLTPTLKTNGDVVEVNVPSHNSLFSWEEVTVPLENNLSDLMYSYKPFRSNIRHFKFDETYRLGIQGQFKNGKWSSPIWLGEDKKVDKRYQTWYKNKNEINLSYIYGKYSVSDSLKKWFKDPIESGGCGFIKVRPVMVPLNYSDRTIIAQGIVNNTLCVMKNRFSTGKSNTPFSYPDYLFRTNGKQKTKRGVDSDSIAYNGQYSHFDLLKLNNRFIRQSSTDGYGDTSRLVEIMGNYSHEEYHDIYDNGLRLAFTQYTKPFNNDYDRDFFVVDKNMVNFWSPDLINNPETLNSYIKNTSSVGLYGFAFQTALKSNFQIDFGGIENVEQWGGKEFDAESNYYTGSEYLNQRYQKNIFPRLKSVSDGSDTPRNIYRAWHCIPIWTPKDYILKLPERDGGWYGDTTTINFTKLSKSGYNYFGINNNLKSNIRFKYDINKPNLLFNDSTIFYNSNLCDNVQNNGNVIYSKSVEKIYPSGSYPNTFKWPNAHPDKKGVQISDNINTESGKYYVDSGLSIKYNTANHAIFSFKENNGKFSCIPRIKNAGETFDYELFDNPKEWYRGDLQTNGFRLDLIDRGNLNNQLQSTDNSTKNTSPIFDLYSNVVSDPTSPYYVKYGGNNSDALYSNTWIPCGKSVKITSDDLVVEYTEGDTYIGRFDMLRVFPDDILQIPQHTEIVSFICESFVNMDGRSDVNRNNTDSELMTPGNYGLFNNIYSQKNNYFLYNILDPSLFNTKNYSNTIIWSKTKSSGEIVDTWTQMNMLSSIDLEGVNGEISSINLFNNNLYVFQNTAIAQLLYNERVQQQMSDGVSLEMVNGYKVPDYKYITNQTGSSNKWSIIEGELGVYYIDYINKSFNLLLKSAYGNEFKDLSSEFGLKSWFNNNVSNKDYTLSYDKINNDIYIHDDDVCLNFSEITKTFISFYDYIKVLQMKNVWDKFISIRSESQSFGELLYSESLEGLTSEDSLDLFTSENYKSDSTSVWINNEGDYNIFYGQQKPFYVEYLLNPDPLSDKIFNTFEYRLNDQFIDWNEIEVHNWYQYSSLNNKQYSSNMKRKFNVNRVQIPRQTKELDGESKLIDIDTRNSLNRIRSTWAKLKLTHNITNENINRKFDMQDLNITYTI